MDEVFGVNNFLAIISVTKTAGGLTTVSRIPSRLDYLVWYAKDSTRNRYHQLYIERPDDIQAGFNQLLLADGTVRGMFKEEREDPSRIPRGARIFRSDSLTKPGPGSKYTIEVDGRRYDSGNRWWGSPKESIMKLIEVGRVRPFGDTLRYLKFVDDFPLKPLNNLWEGLAGAKELLYVVQTNEEIIKRALLMTTDPGDLVLDPTCGSGTTAYVAEQWGRRWITCDTSRVALALARQRLMIAVFDYYELAHPEEGVGSGFNYRTVPHITLESIANNPEIRKSMTREQIDAAIADYADQETLYDQPHVDKRRVRVSGPFTVEAVPAPTVRSLEEIETDSAEQLPADASIARRGATLRHAEWRDELLKTGIRGKGGQMIHFSRVEPLAGTRWLHADAETKGEKPERVVFSFGPEHAPLEQRQVELAWEEARTLIPKPSLIVLAAFQFDPEAAKDIDQLTREKTGMTFLTAQMNADLLTEDLKKKRASNQSYWLVGRPDVELRQIKKGDHKDKWEVEVRGFDYYNTRTGTIESGDASKIAMWLLDTDYDGRSLFPRQVFFPMADDESGWTKLAKNLKAEIDPELVESYRGTVSLPFEAGPNKRAAVKVIDDRGVESLKVIDIR